MKKKTLFFSTWINVLLIRRNDIIYFQSLCAGCYSYHLKYSFVVFVALSLITHLTPQNVRVETRQNYL